MPSFIGFLDVLKMSLSQLWWDVKRLGRAAWVIAGLGSGNAVLKMLSSWSGKVSRYATKCSPGRISWR